MKITNTRMPLAARWICRHSTATASMTARLGIGGCSKVRNDMAKHSFGILGDQMPTGVWKRPWRDPKAELMKRVKLRDDGCWVWMGNTMKKDGYGYLTINKQSWLAHRLSWVTFRGPIPDGLCVCHHCDNPPCINPDHLFLGTIRDNIHDALNKGRPWAAASPNFDQSKLVHHRRANGLK